MPASPLQTAPRLLVVDDDQELCALMTEFLTLHGYDVQTAYDGVAGLELALTSAPDLVVLDVMMPRLDGFDVLRHLRRGSQVPVLVLSARTAPEDRIEGLNVGADDYLLKPFVADELLARVGAILRRSRQAPRSTLRVGALLVESGARRAWLRDRELELTSMEFGLLELLATTPATIVSRDTIAGVLYGRETTAYERTIDVHVSHLRKKLAHVPEIRIQSIRGTGYVLVGGE